MSFLQDFPDRNSYTFLKGGTSKYNGPLSSMNLCISDRHSYVIQEFFWIEWLFYHLDVANKFNKLALLWQHLDELGIEDISSSSINDLETAQAEKFINCLKQLEYSNSLRGFGFLYFDNELLRSEYIGEDHNACKLKINELINEIYDKNQSIIMYWACYYNEFKKGKINGICGENFDIWQYANSLYPNEIMEMHTLSIQSACKTLLAYKVEAGEIIKNVKMWNRISSEECSSLDFNSEKNNQIKLKKVLSSFIDKQFFPNNIKYGDHKYLVNIGLIKLIYDVSCDLLKVDSEVSKNVLLRTLIESSVTLCFLNENSVEEADIFREYIEYGDSKIAKTALKFDDVMARLKLRGIINPNITPIQIEINHKNFKDNKIKSKFKTLDQLELYEKYYEYTSIHAHAFWPAVFTNSYELCTNAMHNHYLFGESGLEVIDVCDIALYCWEMIREQKIEYVCEW